MSRRILQKLYELTIRDVLPSKIGTRNGVAVRDRKYQVIPNPPETNCTNQQIL